MKIIGTILLSLCIFLEANGWSDNKVRTFKDKVLFGVSTSAYQVEGGWNSDGKGESIWDRYFHENPKNSRDGTNGDVASDSYNFYKRDVEMLRELGVDFYRFSISWPRILPTGLPNEVNKKGIEYYNKLIKELLNHNIEPMITLYHFDLPQHLQDLGGWVNPYSVDWFEAYAKVVFEAFGNKVKYWVTVNQPNFCMYSYGDGTIAPGVKSRGLGEYMCLKNIMLAHAKAYRLYEKEYKKKYKGLVGISLSVNWADPINNQTENKQAAEDYNQFTIDMYMDPIWSKSGDFPKLVKDVIAKRSKEQGYPASRLPKLTSEEIKLLKGSADFLGLNHYTTFLVTHAEGMEDVHVTDLSVELSQSEQWKQAKSPWLKSAPYGIYKALIYVNQKYDYPPIFITEHGWSTGVGLKDKNRIENLKGYFSGILLAVEDGTELMGYTAWSLMDNVEWTAGISERFGLYEVDFESEEKTRTPRQSALFYKHVIESRTVDPQWKPKKNMKMEFSERRNRKKPWKEL